MSELKITINQLKNYLGTGLKVEFKGINYEIQGSQSGLIISIDSFEGQNGRVNTNYLNIDKCKPICYRLSDLDKFIPEFGFVPIEKIDRVLDFNWNTGDTEENLSDLFKEDIKDFTEHLLFTDVQQLFQWHFWPFGDEYFEAGLVIDKLLNNPTPH